MGKKKIYLLISISVFLTLIFSSCFMAKGVPEVSGYAQFYDGSNFSADAIQVKLSLLDSNTGAVATYTTTTDSKGYYSFSKVAKAAAGQFYTLEFSKGSADDEFEFEKIPFFSKMMTISSADGGYLTITATHVTSDAKIVGFEIARSSDGKLLFSRPFQWFDSSTGYNDYIDVPYGSYDVSLYYFDSKGKLITPKSTPINLSSGNSYITIKFDMSK